MPDIAPTYDLIDRGGVIATLLVVIAIGTLALIRGWIVTGPHYRDVKESEEKLRGIVEGMTKGLETIRDEMREQRLEHIASSRRGD